MRYVFYFIVILINSGINAQKSLSKPPIDISLLGKWPFLGSPGISSDGRYFHYSLFDVTSGSRTLVLQGVNTQLRKEYPGASDPFFSKDNECFYFRKKDTLCSFLFASDSLRTTANIGSWKYPKFSIGDWYAYHIKSDEGRVVLKSIFLKKEIVFKNVIDYLFDDYGNSFIIKSKNIIGKSQNGLQIVNLKNLNVNLIWSGDTTQKIGELCFDRTGTQVAFIIETKLGTKSKNAIWYFKTGMDKAEILLEDKNEFISPSFIIGGPVKFSKRGSWIFFKRQRMRLPNIKPALNAIMVNVWSYKDDILQPQQLVDLTNDYSSRYTSVVNPESKKVIQLETETEELKTYPDQVTGDYIVVAGKYIEPWWKFDRQPSFYVVSLKDGTRKLLKKESNTLVNFSFSPAGNWLVYFDRSNRNYFSVELATSKIRNVTDKINTGVCNEYSGVEAPLAVAPVAAWSEDEERVFIYDNYDIWEADLFAKKLPQNVTNGYGLKHSIKLRFVYGLESQTPIEIISNDSPILLTGFNNLNKYNGFYWAKLGRKSDPEFLTLGPYTYYRTKSQKPHYYSFSDGEPPIKAGSLDLWIVKRQSEKEYPNYFVTSDFKRYHALTNFEPQKVYNWLTSELINFRQLDGNMCQGILYKPENFDTHKKYPIIFNYYEKLSHRMYEFPVPQYSGANIDIPWFVSHGYLVFTPDIYYKPGNLSGKSVGEWAYNAVVGAAQYLAKLPYVDRNRMGLQGHSFGAGETNYILTHSSLFAAVAEAAGNSDPISAYLTLVPFSNSTEHYNKQTIMEVGHERYGATPWERPDLYLKNSAVLNAMHVTAPLLIMHNVKDNQIQWRQGVELYLALRRLGKRVWMLQYDNGSHVLYDSDALDYTIRLTQFFDHYLKGALPPRWMTEGVRAELKGIESKYELDSSGKIP